ncbi:MAG TPA: hypothetical protein VGC42_22170 [Kofleriaceae bacterium]
MTLLSPLAISACGDDPPPTPAETRSRISTDLGNVLHASNAAFAGGALPDTANLSVFDQLLGTSATAALPDMTSVNVDADASVKYLNEQLFTDANHVGNGVFTIPPALLCQQTATDPGSTGAATTVDPDCVAKLGQLDLRIRTATSGDSLTFALQVDADHDEPLRLELTHTSVALTVDFDDLQHAEAAIITVLGDSAADMANAALSGAITGKLAVLGPAKVQASLAIDRALSLRAAAHGSALDGPDAFLFTSAKADGLSITLDGTAKSGTFAAALAKTVFRLPANEGKQSEVDLPGLSATATFTAGQPLKLTHLGLGDGSTTLAINGQRAETIDLNPTDGRALDVTVTRDDAAGQTTIAVSPRLDLRIAIDHAVLGASSNLFDLTRLQLDGTLIGSDHSDQVKIGGSLTITTDPASYGVSATAGQCVTGEGTTDPATGLDYTRWTAGACL